MQHRPRWGNMLRTTKVKFHCCSSTVGGVGMASGTVMDCLWLCVWKREKKPGLRGWLQKWWGAGRPRNKYPYSRQPHESAFLTITNQKEWKGGYKAGYKGGVRGQQGVERRWRVRRWGGERLVGVRGRRSRVSRDPKRGLRYPVLLALSRYITILHPNRNHDYLRRCACHLSLCSSTHGSCTYRRRQPQRPKPLE